jgi:type IV pilus assembly protein PilQ
MYKRIAILLACLPVIIICAGCLSVAPSLDMAVSEGSSSGVAGAERLYAMGDHRGAVTACIALTQEDPLMPGLAELQSKIVKSLAEERKTAAAHRSAPATALMAVEVDENKAIPLTYKFQQSVQGETNSIHTEKTDMETMLDTKVVVHLDSVDLNSFILAVGSDAGVNIIADSNIATTEQITVHADNVPLSEILEYASRNLSVDFFLGQNLIWVTPKDQQSQDVTPMDTRVYRLRKGLSSENLANASKITIVEAIERFVPATAGADLMFDINAHVLIAKNSRKNLAKIEDIIEALDVCPPQILIEARFIYMSISDLRELGVDWLMTGDVPVTRTHEGEARTIIAAGATANYAGFPNNSEGLNLTYQGLLTDPTFQAVLHALEVSGKSRTLSVPKVTTVNNRPAQMRIGEDFRYFEEYDIQTIPAATSDAGSSTYQSLLVPVGSPQVEELGIQLDVVPSVGADLKSISLHVVPEISEFVRFEYYQTGSSSASGNNANGTTNSGQAMVKLPIFRRSKIETEVIVQSGETVVMGGLITSTETEDTRGIPILSSIPLLGRLFEHNVREEVKRNLLIFVTATILSERGESLVPIVNSAEEGWRIK